MTDASRNPDDYCYRHPDRLSFVLCERCGRTICLECQTSVGGRVLCPDDAKRANVTMLPVNQRPKKSRAARVRQRSRLFAWVTDATPIVTYAILVAFVVVLIADSSSQGLVTRYLGVFPTGLAAGPDVLHQPWSLLTSMVLPGGILGLLINGYSTYFLGSQLERLFGHRKLLVLYITSGFGASVITFLLNGSLTYSIGAVFGLVGATVIVVRRMGGNMIFLYVTCAVSLVFAILFGQWQGAIGGALAGIATTLTYLYDDGSARHRRSRLLLVALVGLLIVLAVLRAFVFGG